jgi:hypothetical protein
MHWCLGMYGSGSTWVFNAALKTAAALYPNRPVQSGFAMNCNDLGFLKGDTSTQIVKTHETDNALRERLSYDATTVLLSIRDPRDSLASLMTYHNLSYDDCLGRVLRSATYCSDIAEHPDVVLLRYEDLFFDDSRTIAVIARTFGTELSDANRDRIFLETRRPAIEAIIANIESLPTVFHHADPAETLDTVTQWHRHHAGRTGEIGRWRGSLTPAQISDIESRLGTFMEKFSYSI